MKRQLVATFDEVPAEYLCDRCWFRPACRENEECPDHLCSGAIFVNPTFESKVVEIED